MLGLQMAFQGKHIMITISSLVLGSIIGEAMDIEAKLERFGTWLAKKVQSRRKTTSAGDEGAFVQGFMYASLIYCVGAMAIVGSIQTAWGRSHDLVHQGSPGWSQRHHLCRQYGRRRAFFRLVRIGLPGRFNGSGRAFGALYES